MSIKKISVKVNKPANENMWDEVITQYHMVTRHLLHAIDFDMLTSL